MKYGQQFQAQSVPQWAPYNVDYNELKNLIKVNTTRDEGQAIAIPGQTDSALDRFESLFYNELSNQHDRVDLFVKSKSDEISRRLQFYQDAVQRLLAKFTYSSSRNRPISQKRRERFAKMDIQIEKCGEDIRSLQRFVAAQRMAFHKILKKYKKWTGSRSLSERFNDQILGSPKSFVRRDFASLYAKYEEILGLLRSYTPDSSSPISPESSRPVSRRPSTQVVIPPPPQQGYWNEYDNGSEGENEPYTVLVSPEDDTFPGEGILTLIFSTATKPVISVKEWLNPPQSHAERRPLLTNGRVNSIDGRQSMADTDLEDEAYASSSDFPSGYVAHYATFPSVKDQRFSKSREQALYFLTIGAFVLASLFLAISCVLVATGKHKVRAEVDAGAVIGIVSSLFCDIVAYGAMLYRHEKLSWIHRIAVASTFVIIGILNCIVLGRMAEGV